MKFSFPVLLIACSLISCTWLIFAEDVREKPAAAAPVPQEQENISSSSSSSSSKETVQVQSDKIVNSEPLEIKSVEPSELVVDEVRHAKIANTMQFSSEDILAAKSAIISEVSSSTDTVPLTLTDTATLETSLKSDAISDPSSQAFPSNETSLNSTAAVQKDPTLPTPINRTAEEQELVVPINLDADKQTSTSSSSNGSEQQRPEVKPEDIPSFSEWAQKQLEEAERERANSSVLTGPANGSKPSSGLRVRSKNYASLDCGAKIAAANPEAVSPSSVLSQSRDEYLLNACTSRIWFVVELCEAVQAKKIEVANFELFSSSPKDISVYLSDRFPSREWSSVGAFTAKDERDIQSFDLSPHLFGKYIKFEMHSHHGGEHFCPISMFRVYGTSEFEVLEKEDQGHALADEDGDDDEALDNDGTAPKNLFSSATDAVISIVRKAAEVLGNKGNNSNQTTHSGANLCSPLISTCTTLKHLVVCDGCTDTIFGRVYELLSCKTSELLGLLRVPFIKRTLLNADVCSQYGLDLKQDPTLKENSCSFYLESLLPDHYVAALCNGLAVLENKAVLNASKQFPNMTDDVASNVSNSVTNVEIQITELPPPPPKTLQLTIPNKTANDWSSLSGEAVNVTTPVETKTEPEAETNSSLINPTKTLQRDDLLNNNDTKLAAGASSGTSGEKEAVKPTVSVHVETTGASSASSRVAGELEVEIDGSSDTLAELEMVTESTETGEESIDRLISDAFSGESAASVAVPPSTTPQAQKESVFLRLSNRIKALERNMSLSSQYLEELSRRYRKQVDEMQKLLDSTVSALKEETRRKDEENRRLQHQLTTLSATVDALVAEKTSWMGATYWLFLAAIAAVFIMTFCRRSPDQKRLLDDDPDKLKLNLEPQRRRSIDIISHQQKPAKVRRPSEEALLIAGTYQHLMLENDSRKRKKKKSLPTLSRSPSNSNSNSNNSNARELPAEVRKLPYFRPPGKFPTTTTDWIDGNVFSRGFEDVPFLLEEEEHSALEPTLFQEERLNGRLPNNFKFVPSLPHIRTAINARSARSGSPGLQQNGNKLAHKKSASVDETRSRPEGSEVSSVSSSLDDKASPADKKKKGGLRRIFKKVF